MRVKLDQLDTYISTVYTWSFTVFMLFIRR